MDWLNPRPVAISSAINGGDPGASAAPHQNVAKQPIWFEITDADGAPILDFDGAQMVNEVGPVTTSLFGAA